MWRLETTPVLTAESLLTLDKRRPGGQGTSVTPEGLSYVLSFQLQKKDEGW